jgi:S-adenosylmethionine hydrolase
VRCVVHTADRAPERAGVDPSTLKVISRRRALDRATEDRREFIDFNRLGDVHLNVRPAHLAAASLDQERVLRVEAVSASTEAKGGSTYADFEPGEYGLLFDPVGG